MQIIKIHFDTQNVTRFRNAVADSFKPCMDITHKGKGIKCEYPAWDRTCTIMDRLSDTLDYLNDIELGHCADKRSAFDFYDFLNNCYVVIDCVKTLGHIFQLEERHIADIEKSQSVFGNDLTIQSSDGRYFEYIRSLTSVHPLNTNRQEEFLNGDAFHCCPFVTWKDSFAFSGKYPSDLEAWIYTSRAGSAPLIIPLYVHQFVSYLNKWIDLIPKIIEAKTNYANDVYNKLRETPVKPSSAFNNTIAYLTYLKDEYCNRFGDGCSDYFDEYIRVFTIKLTDQRNNKLLSKYKNAIIYSLFFLSNELQNLCCDGYENSGIRYTDKNGKHTLFCLLGSIGVYESSFSRYSCELSKVSYLEPSCPDCGEKYYARRLLEYPKELINKFVYFTNTESNDEAIVLIKLALYLESLTRKCILNKNIPNLKKYRIEMMPKNEYEQLLTEDLPPTEKKDPENFFANCNSKLQ